MVARTGAQMAYEVFNESTGEVFAVANTREEAEARADIFCASYRDVAWIDDNDGRGPCKLSNSIRVF
jgi:hypothetical protein